MNYKESKEILDKIKSSKKILVNCYVGPDEDSVGSALAFFIFLKNINKDVRVVCKDPLQENLKFLDSYNEVEIVDFSNFDFSEFDLIISPDTATWQRLVGNNEVGIPKDIEIVVIDHHYDNEKFGRVNIIDSKMASTAEIIYRLFEDWDYEITKEMATCLMTGIIGDTGVFQFPNTSKMTFDIASDLISKGAEKDKIIFELRRNLKFGEVKFLGKFFYDMVLEKDHKFVWSAINNKDYLDLGEPENVDLTDAYMQGISDTEFAIRMIEREKNVLSVSFRSRKDFDVSQIASGLGGGGHKAAAGAKIMEKPFNQAVDIVLEIAKKYAKSN